MLTTNNNEPDYKATVLVWGVKQTDDSKLGLTNILKTHGSRLLYGGNPGHAAIKLTFPVNTRNHELINQFCDKTEENEIAIPYKMINKNGKFYYEVYFSWWPERGSTRGYKDNKSSSLYSLEEDKIEQRLGVHVKWPKDTDPIFIQKRSSGFLLNKRQITLGRALTVNYPTFPSNADITKYVDPQLQKIILGQIKAYKQEIENNQDNDRTKLLINFLDLYEKHWNAVNYCEDQLKFLNKKNDPKKLSKKQQQEIKDLTERLNNEKKIKNLLKSRFQHLFKTNIKEFLSFGREPDKTINLPLMDSFIPEQEYAIGLDLMPMLQKMKELANDGIKYDMYNKNCAATSLAIIDSGIRPQDQPWMAKSIEKVTGNFKNTRWLSTWVVTPQDAYNTAIQLKDNISQFKPTILDYSKKTQPVLDKFNDLEIPTTNTQKEKSALEKFDQHKFEHKDVAQCIKYIDSSTDVGSLQQIINEFIEKTHKEKIFLSEEDNTSISNKIKTKSIELYMNIFDNHPSSQAALIVKSSNPALIAIKDCSLLTHHDKKELQNTINILVKNNSNKLREQRGG